MVGLGLGGEWSAGATLVAETWPAPLRQRAMSFMQSGWSIGYMLAAVVSGFVLPRWGWRVLFLTGLLPALLTIYIRRGVEEPEVWRRNATADRGRVSAPSSALPSAPSPSAQRHSLPQRSWVTGDCSHGCRDFCRHRLPAGGAGADIVQTSAWVFLIQSGGFAGYIAFGFLCERFGRRRTFTAYVLCAALLTLVYGNLPAWGFPSLLLPLGPLVGFFGTGFFSLLALFSRNCTRHRFAARGRVSATTFGRLLCAAAPWATGTLADHSGIGAALGLNAAFFLMAAVLIRFLPVPNASEVHL